MLLIAAILPLTACDVTPENVRTFIDIVGGEQPPEEALQEVTSGLAAFQAADPEGFDRIVYTSLWATIPREGPDGRVLTREGLAKLRFCESTDNYEINTGNSYYGAYQFDKRTWDGVVSTLMPWLIGTYPHQASSTEQDAATMFLWEQRGARPWPKCGPKAA